MSGFSGIFSDILGRISDVDKKINTLETVEYIKFFPILGAVDNLLTTTVNGGNTYTSGNLRGTGGISTRAKGFLGSLWLDPLPTADSLLEITPDNDTPSAYSQIYYWKGGVDTDRQLISQLVFCFLGTSGGIKIANVGANATLYINAFGYWE